MVLCQIRPLMGKVYWKLEHYDLVKVRLMSPLQDLSSLKGLIKVTNMKGDQCSKLERSCQGDSYFIFTNGPISGSVD